MLFNGFLEKTVKCLLLAYNRFVLLNFARNPTTAIACIMLFYFFCQSIIVLPIKSSAINKMDK
jgi:hypothetical protein